MAAGIPARLTAAEGRKFGFTLAGAFLVIGGLLMWRHRVGRAEVVFALAAGLGLAGLLMPTRLGPVERGWMRVAHLLSKVTTPIFMGIVYYVVVTPMGFIRRRSGSPLVRRARAQSGWEPHTAATTAERMERQF